MSSIEQEINQLEQKLDNALEVATMVHDRLESTLTDDQTVELDTLFEHMYEGIELRLEIKDLEHKQARAEMEMELG